MTAPNWQTLATVAVQARPVGLWNLAVDYVPGSRLLRFTVLALDQQNKKFSTIWNPVKGTDCGADGIVTNPLKTGLLCTGAQYGALIGKLGGSSADLPDSSSPAGPYPNKKVFGVGSYCVISLSNLEGGPLFLTMNDSPDGFEGHQGDLHALIEYYST